MTENEARQMEVDIEWNGKANVCVHCGKVPETHYVATGHDHTDYSIRYCFCRAQVPSIEQLTARVRELEEENARLRTVPMKYRRMQFNAQLQDENDELRAQLAAAQEQLAIRTQEFDAAWRQLAKAEQRVAEREEEKRLLEDDCGYQMQWKREFREQLEYSQKQLAAEQLNNKLLREALEAVIKVHGYESGIPVEAIYTQANTEALDAYVKQKIKEYY